jgi:hypothetical protein
MRSPKFLVRIVARHGIGYAYCHFCSVFFDPYQTPSRRTILSARILVRSQRTCCQRAAEGVSCSFECFVLHRQTLLSSFFPAFTISPLQPGMEYFGPSALEEANLCLCSTVGYSLASACGGCQQGEWISCDSHRCSLLNSPGLYMCH